MSEFFSSSAFGTFVVCAVVSFIFVRIGTRPGMQERRIIGLDAKLVYLAVAACLAIVAMTGLLRSFAQS